MLLCNTFYFCKVGDNVAVFTPDFSDLNLLSFFLGQSSLEFVNSVDLFKDLTFGFVDFLYCFCILYFMDVCPNFYYFLLSCVRFSLFFFF